MRLLEEHEQKFDTLKLAIAEGDKSGESNQTLKEISLEARQELKNEL